MLALFCLGFYKFIISLGKDTHKPTEQAIPNIFVQFCEVQFFPVIDSNIDLNAVGVSVSVERKRTPKIPTLRICLF